jgi:hypothetical protein
MITINSLKEKGFISNIDTLKKFCSISNLKNIYISPPINSNDTLYLMVKKEDKCTENDLFNFITSVTNLFQENFSIYIFDVDEAKEAIKKNLFSKKGYQRALDKSILLDNLKNDISLESQWEEQSKKNSENSSDSYFFTPLLNQEQKSVTREISQNKRKADDLQDFIKNLDDQGFDNFITELKEKRKVFNKQQHLILKVMALL